MSRLLQCNDKNKDAFTCIAAYQWDCINRFIFNDSVALKYVYMSMPETLIYACMIYETTRTICISWRWFSSCKQLLCWQSQSVQDALKIKLRQKDTSRAWNSWNTATLSSVISAIPLWLKWPHIHIFLKAIYVVDVLFSCSHGHHARA